MATATVFTRVFFYAVAAAALAGAAAPRGHFAALSSHGQAGRGLEQANDAPPGYGRLKA